MGLSPALDNISHFHRTHDNTLQSHYPDSILTSPILLMQSVRLDGNKYQCHKVIGLTLLGFKLPTFRTGSLLSVDLATVVNMVETQIGRRGKESRHNTRVMGQDTAAF